MFFMSTFRLFIKIDEFAPFMVFLTTLVAQFNYVTGLCEFKEPRYEIGRPRYRLKSSILAFHLKHQCP